MNDLFGLGRVAGKQNSRSNMLRKFNAILDYVILIVILAIVMATMGKYIKRGLMGKYRETGDAFGYGRQYVNATARAQILSTFKDCTCAAPQSAVTDFYIHHTGSWPTALIVSISSPGECTVDACMTAFPAYGGFSPEYTARVGSANSGCFCELTTASRSNTFDAGKSCTACTSAACTSKYGAAYSTATCQ